MRPRRIFETVLYAEDLAAAERFYREAIGLEVIRRDDLFVVLRCGDAVLLIFDPRKSSLESRDVPSPRNVGNWARGVRCKAGRDGFVETPVKSGRGYNRTGSGMEKWRSLDLFPRPSWQRCRARAADALGWRLEILNLNDSAFGLK